MNIAIPKMKGTAEIKGRGKLFSIHFHIHSSPPQCRSFKGANRKRPRTETADGAVEVKKDEKEDKEVNGENKESSMKENVKELDKKNETILKSVGESAGEVSALSLANEVKG